jgi:hypothetical protein
MRDDKKPTNMPLTSRQIAQMHHSSFGKCCERFDLPDVHEKKMETSPQKKKVGWVRYRGWYWDGLDAKIMRCKDGSLWMWKN